MTNNTAVWQENYVLPSESEYILYVLPFFYIWTSTIENTLFCDYWARFRRHYADPLEIVEKTIPILYVARSKKENYTTHHRNFENMDAFIELLKKHNVHIMDVDEFTSLQPQFDLVLKSKVIIVEQGSGYSMNSVFIAANSHVILLNDCWDVTNIITPFYVFSRKIMSERNTTVEVFSKGKHATPFTVDLEEFEKRLQHLQ
jgi:capsular polysaccharide biosynthesis protein